MNGVPKLLAALAVTAFLGLVLAACGSGKDSTSTTGSTAGGTTSTQKQGGAITTAAGAGKKAGSGRDRGKSGGAHSEAEEASEFAPKHHTDSDGGSKQFEVKGGDNSIQEFGSEATGSDFNKAAAALHNFLDARAEENWAAACSYASKGVIQSLETLAVRSKQGNDSSCAASQEALFGGAPSSELARAAEADVESLRTEGDRAFIIYREAEGAVAAISMAKEGGIWKVAALSGAPLN
jgi:hypothetical protein